MFLANDKETAAKLGEQLQLTRVATGRNVGTDAQGTVARRVPIAAGRCKEAKQRGFRLEALRKAGATVSNVYRAGPTAVAVWGSSVMGIAHFPPQGPESGGHEGLWQGTQGRLPGPAPQGPFHGKGLRG